MRGVKLKYKDEIIVFSLITLIYLAITSIFFSNTTIFYDTQNTYNVLLDTDTGVLFNWNTFALSQDNSKHILFSAIVSLLGYPIYLISGELNRLAGVNYSHAYGLGLIILQILVSSTSITLTYNYMKTLNLKRKTLILITGIMVASFPQLFMSLNVERFIYAQLSLVFFMFVISKVKNQNSYLIDIAAIPLFGITLTNIYLYFINLLLEFKLNVKNILKHMGVFTLASYIIIVATKSYNSLFLVSDTIQSDSSFVLAIPLIEKLKMIILRLIYPTLYFPGYEIVNNNMQQNGAINKLFLLLMILVLIVAVIGGIKSYKEKIPQLCIATLLVNFVLHGIIGYNLVSANIMTIHFTFAIIILLAHFAKTLNKYDIKKFNMFLIIVLLTVIISNIQGFTQILKLGISVYPK